MNRSFWIIRFAPRSIENHIFREIFHYRIKHDTVTAKAREGSISLQLRKDMIVGMIGIETKKYTLITLCNITYLIDNF